MKITIKSENGQKVVDLKNDLQFNATKGEQYVFSNGFSNYVLNLKDNQESVILTFNVDGKSIKVELNGIVPLLQANTENMSNPTAIIINKDLNEKDVDNIVENSNFDGGEIIDRLEALLSKPVELGDNASSNLTLITDYQTLLESLGAAAAGAEAGGNATGNGSSFNSIFSLTDSGLNGIADTVRWENLTESISTIPVDTANTIASAQDTTPIDTTPIDTRVPASVITLSDPTVDEGNQITITATVTNPPQTDLIITLNNGQTITIPAGQTTGSTTFTNPNSEDVYIDNSTETYTIVGTDGGNYKDLVTTDTATVTINDTIQDTTVTLNDVTVDEGTGTAKITATIDNAPTKEPLVLTLSNGATVTFAVGATTAESTPFTIQADDVYNDGETYEITVASTTGGNFENLVTTDTATVTINDTIQDTTVTLNDVTVDEGTGTAKITATIDNAPTKEPLVLTLSNGATVTFAVGATTAESTPFTIQADDVYNDGETYEITVASTTGGNFENLVTTDTATVTINDTIQDTTVTLNDVTVDEGTGTAKITATIDNAPTKEPLVLTLSNGATVTFAVGATTAESTPFTIQADDVYNDGETYEITVASTTGGNFENLVTTDTATVTINDTIQDTTVTLNDVTVDEGTGTAKITATIDNAPTKEPLVLTLSNGATVTFAVGATTAESTPFTIQADDVYNDGETYEITVASTTGGNFENLVTTDTATVTINDTIQDTTVTLNDVTVDEGTGTAKITATIDNAPTKEPLVLTLSNGATVTFAVGATTAESTPFTIQADDVYNDGETYEITVASTTGGNFENLVTTDTATVTINDTIQDTTVTLNDVTVDEGTGTAKITATIDNAPTKEPLVLTLSNGATVTFAVGATTAESTPFTIQADDVYNDGETYEITVASTTGGNFENLVTTDTATVTINDTIQDTTVTLNDVTVDEGTGTAKITATIDNAPTKEPLVLTLSNGATVTFAVGATTAESTPFNIQGDDAYNDGDSYSVQVGSYTGGSEFENLVTTDTATVTINDTTNIVYVDVTASSTDLIEGAGVTYTVTLRNQDGLEVKNHGGLNITLSNGVKIYIPENETSGAGKGIATVGSNTIKVDKIVETATADSGKQFEAIESGKTVTVNASSSTLLNDTAIATENGSENIASEDSLDTNDGQTASGNVLSNDTVNNNTKVSKITFERNETIVESDGNTEIVGKYGTLNISSNGQYTYKVNDDNSDVDALNVRDKLAEYFTYTTSDEKAAVLTVEVEGRNDAPIISKIETNGVTLTGIYNDYRSDNISENITAEDLIKNDDSNSYQFKNENNTLKMDLGTTKTNVDISYEGKNADNKSILGYYEKNADGTIGNLKIIFVDGSDTSAKSIQGITGEIGFFLIPNGANNTNIMNIINGGNYQVERTEDGKIIFSSNGKLATASDVYYTDESLSTEKKDHTIALKSDNPNSIIIGFEDQSLKDGSTDFDYNDFVISVKFTPSESLTNKLFKNVDFSDVDDVNLSEATVTLANAIDGDKINIAGDLKEGITYTTEYKDGKLIIKFSGIASHEAYEEALEAIRFSTKNSENERELKFEIEIKDPNGKTDKNSVVIIGKGFDNDTPTDENEESSQATTFDGEGDIDLTSIIGQYKVNYIDLENGKANDIKLKFDEILADDKEIYIKGDDKDIISLNSELWKEAESIKGDDGVKYNVYTGTNSADNSTIKLFIDDEIKVNHDI